MVVRKATYVSTVARRGGRIGNYDSALSNLQIWIKAATERIMKLGPNAGEQYCVIAHNLLAGRRVFD